MGISCTSTTEDFEDQGRYWSDISMVRQTAKLVANCNAYNHLPLYAHGELNNVEAFLSRRIVAMKEVVKKNRIDPFHFMYDTGLLEHLKRCRARQDAAYRRPHQMHRLQLDG